MTTLPAALVRELAAVEAGQCPNHGVALEPGARAELWWDTEAEPGLWCEPCGAWWSADPAAQTVAKRWPFPRLDLRP